MAKIVRYKGIKIEHGEDGYFSEDQTSFGYCGTLEEIKAEIDDYWRGNEHGPLNGIFGVANAN